MLFARLFGRSEETTGALCVWGERLLFCSIGELPPLLNQQPHALGHKRIPASTEPPHVTASPDLDEQSTANGKPPAGDGAAPASEPASDSEARQQDQRAAEEAAEAASFFVRREGEAAVDYARRVFGRVFTADVERVIGMEVGSRVWGGWGWGRVGRVSVLIN